VKAVEKRGRLYAGKAKTVFETDDADKLILHFRDDTSAFDGERTAALKNKGAVNNHFNAHIMEKLAAAGIATHFEKILGDNESLVKRLDMIGVECVVRNIAAGSICKRLGLEEGRVLDEPLYELFLKDERLAFDTKIGPTTANVPAAPRPARFVCANGWLRRRPPTPRSPRCAAATGTSWNCGARSARSAKKFCANCWTTARAAAAAMAKAGVRARPKLFSSPRASARCRRGRAKPPTSFMFAACMKCCAWSAARCGKCSAPPRRRHSRGAPRWHRFSTTP